MKTGRKNLKYLCLVLFFVAILAGCTGERPEPDATVFVSARKVHGILFDAAKSWKDDAYLSWLSIGSWHSGGRIYASFMSLSDDYNSCLIILTPQTGELEQRIVKHDIPVVHRVPIIETDWVVDSTEAVKILLTFNDVKEVWRLMPANCRDLVLSQYRVGKQWVLVWILAISDCEYETHRFYLDALSGERLELKY